MGARSSLSTARPVGRWCAFVVGPSNGWDRTILGIVVYDGSGNLAFSRWAGSGKALRRGDWKADWHSLSFDPPPTWQEMEKRLGSTGNAMSQARWEGGLATTEWAEDTGMALFRMVTGE